MRVALHFTSAFKQPLVDADGRLIPGDSGRYLLRRLVELFDDPIVVDDIVRQCDGFETRPVSKLDVNQTIVVTFDVLAAMSLYSQMKTWVGAFPKIVNFVWWNVSEIPDKESRAAMAVSCGMFPTFCNSARTAGEVSDVVSKFMSGSVARKARVEFSPLGIDVTPPPPRVVRDVPVVMYPAMWLFARKNPDRFLSAAMKVKAATGCEVRAALSEHNLGGDMADEFRRAGVEVSGLVPKSEYWGRLAETDAFLATAQDESYGLQYVEAMYAGVVGVFPDRAWVRSIVPPGYPFVYGSQQDAEAMLYYVVTNRDAARELVAGMPEWIRVNHDRTAFDETLKKQVHDWWPDRE